MANVVVNRMPYYQSIRVLMPEVATRMKPDLRTDIPAHNADETALWNAVGEEWVASRRQRLWRQHNDWVVGGLLRRWLQPGSGPALKTDLFDEALSDGLMPAMSDHASAVHGVDIAPEIVHSAGKRHPNMAVKVADIRELPYGDGTFATVVSPSTLDHFETTDEIHTALAEIRRVMTAGGRLVLLLDNPRNPKIALRARLGTHALGKIKLAPYHYGKTLGPKEMAAAVDAAGFDVLETSGCMHCPRVSAVFVARQIERLSAPRLEAAFLAMLRPFEQLERLPTRYITGHFSALVAEARD